jgi:glyoxylase-like metal-dependent hydrolase (beta-lactamase superfamily II)
MFSHLLFAALTLATSATEVGPGVLLVPGSFIRGQQPDGNSVILRGKRGLVVVDTGRHAAHTQKVLDAAAALKQPVEAVINTHWHLDHIGGNARVRQAYPAARVYASGAFAGARTGFLAEYRAQLAELLKTTTDPVQRETFETDLQLIDSADKLAPDVVVDRSQALKLAGRNIDVHLAKHAATAGDLWMYDPASRIAIAGDLVTLPVPFLDTACPSGWSSALAELERTDFKLLIPGHGAPMTRADFAVYRKAFDNLVACSASSSEKGACIDGWMKDAAPFLRNDDPAWVRMLADYYVGAVLRGEPKVIAERCGM